MSCQNLVILVIMLHNLVGVILHHWGEDYRHLMSKHVHQFVVAFLHLLPHRLQGMIGEGSFVQIVLSDNLFCWYIRRSNAPLSEFKPISCIFGHHWPHSRKSQKHGVISDRRECSRNCRHGCPRGWHES